MQSFEIQIFKQGNWEFDSYFNDRDTALDEACRMLETTRHGGIRVLEDKYDDNRNETRCDVIFSRMLKNAGNMATTRTSVPGHRAPTAAPRATAARDDFKDARKGRKAPQKSEKSPIRTLVILAIAMLVIGIGAIVGLRGIVEF